MISNSTELKCHSVFGKTVIGSTSINSAIDLGLISEKLIDAMHEPEQFLALIHRVNNPDAIILLFSSGKMAVTAKSLGDVNEAVERCIGEIQNIVPLKGSARYN